MTFTEAALEVLRTAGEPLHYKKITELAIERNLLSHVGKTPEVTMSSRLAMMVKKDRGQAPIMKVKPGVFAIRESALQGQSLSPAALAAINEIEGFGADESAAAPALTEAAPAQAGQAAQAGTEEPAKAPQLPGADVFPEEEGDDDPILAGLEQESEGGDRGGRRRRRRRRRGKGEKAETQQPEVSVRPEPAREAGRDRPRENFRDRSRHERFDRQDRQERQERSDRQDRNQDRNQERNNGRHVARGEERNTEERERDRSEDASLDWNRQPGDGDLLGKDLADAVWSVMSRGDRMPHSFSRVAELLVRRGRLSGAPAALAPTIAAAVRADIARAELQRGRSRFRLRAGRLSLAEWQLPKSLSRAEQDMLSSAERYGSEVRRALIQKLSELPTAGFAELLATWLNAEGVTALRAVRRPGSSGSELHFAGTRKTGSEELRLAIVVQRNGRDIDREAVIDVRGALHHYGQAQAAWVVTLGRITSGAREEAGAQAAACALFDGNALASAMERLGIAMRRHVIAHHEIDYELLEALGDSPEQRERREREQQRERQKHNERPQRARGEREQGESLPPPAASQQDDEDEEHVELESEEVEELVARKALRDADWDEEDADETQLPAADRSEEDEEDEDDEGGASEDEGDDPSEDDEGAADDAEPESFRDELEDASREEDAHEDDEDDEDDESGEDFEGSARDEGDDTEDDADDSAEHSEDDADHAEHGDDADEDAPVRRRERG